MSETLTTSQSELKLFRFCMKAHDYKYRQRLIAKRRPAPMVKGQILHAMVDAWVTSRMKNLETLRDPWQVLQKYEEQFGALWKEEQEEYGDLIGDITRIFEAYAIKYAHDGLTYTRSEQFFVTSLTPSIRLLGYIDRLAMDEQDRRWLQETKFHRNLPGDEQRLSDLQTVLFVWSWNREMPREKIDGIIWDYGRAKPPTIPEQLKNGELTQRKNIDTTYETYLAEIRRLKLDPKNYQETLTRLKEQPDSFFRRIRLPTPPKSMIDRVVEDARQTATMIQHLRGIAPRTGMSVPFACERCEFRKLCQAELRGHDADFIRKANYEERETYAHGKETEDTGE